MVLASSSFTAPAAAGIRWLSLSDAAARSGKSEGHLRRLCGEQWMPDGLAALRTPPDGGSRQTWFIREDADPSLARVATAEQIGAELDLRTLTGDQRAELLRREQIVRDWLSRRAAAVAASFNIAEAMERFLSLVPGLCRATLYNWTAEYERAGRAGLVDGRWNTADPNEAVGAADEFFEEVQRLWLTQRGRSKRLCYDHACFKATDKSWAVIPYRTICRKLDALHPHLVKINREGMREFDANHGPFRSRDYSVLASNEVWESDHHQFDVWVQSAANPAKYVRPWLTAWMDVRSRMFVGWWIGEDAGTSATIVRALKLAITVNGVPQSVHVDNGKDYDSRILQGMSKIERHNWKNIEINERPKLLGIFPMLGVTVHHARPYNAKAKTIERSFNTVCGRFSKMWETYSGGSTQTRPDDLGQQLAAGRAPTFADFCASFADWVDSDYHHRVHQGDSMGGKCPAAVYAEQLAAKRAVSESAMKMAFLRFSKALKIRRNGVTFEGLTYGANQLAEWQGKSVIVGASDDDRNQVHIFNPDLSLLCVVRCNEKLPYMGASKEQMADAGRDRKAARLTARKAFEQRPRLVESMADTLARRAAEQRGAATQAEPQSIEPIRTPFDVKAALTEQEGSSMRIAAGGGGGDSMSVFGYRSRDIEEDEPTPAAFEYRRPDDGGAA